jgi:hypothetical protein
MATVMERSKLYMKTKVNIDNILTVLLWIKTIYTIEGKKFNYQNLLEQSETYKYSNTPLDTKIHSIDELMIDAFRVYDKLRKTKDKFNDVLEKIDIPMLNDKILVSKETLTTEISKYEEIFEDLMENYRYEYPETRGIQKGILSEKMNEYVADEEYEKAAKVRDIIKEC